MFTPTSRCKCAQPGLIDTMRKWSIARGAIHYQSIGILVLHVLLDAIVVPLFAPWMHFLNIFFRTRHSGNKRLTPKMLSLAMFIIQLNDNATMCFLCTFMCITVIVGKLQHSKIFKNFWDDTS